MTLPVAVGAAAGSTGSFARYDIVRAEPGADEMNLMVGSSWPTYQPLSSNRVALPLTILIGSVQSMPAMSLTVRYALLHPLQSISPSLFGLTPAFVRVGLIRGKRRGGGRPGRARQAELTDHGESYCGHQ